MRALIRVTDWMRLLPPWEGKPSYGHCYAHEDSPNGRRNLEVDLIWNADRPTLFQLRWSWVNDEAASGGYWSGSMGGASLDDLPLPLLWDRSTLFARMLALNYPREALHLVEQNLQGFRTAVNATRGELAPSAANCT